MKSLGWLLGVLLSTSALGQVLLPEFPPGVFSSVAATSGTPVAPTYTGIGDLSLSNLKAYWGFRCLTKSPGSTINVADITDAATGNTSGTRLQCGTGGGGVITADASASDCTFVTGNACSALAVTCASTCNVRELYDQEGNGYSFIQATNANRPTFLQSGCGYSGGTTAYPYCMSFLGSSSQYMATGTVTAINQTFDAVTVSERTGTFTSASDVLAFSTSAYIGYQNSTGKGFIAFSSGVAENASNSVWHAFQVEAAGASSIFNVDSTVNSPVSPGTQNTGTKWYVGASASPSNYLTGNVSELFVTSSTNAGSFSTINTNIHSYWGF